MYLRKTCLPVKIPAAYISFLSIRLIIQLSNSYHPTIYLFLCLFEHSYRDLHYYEYYEIVLTLFPFIFRQSNNPADCCSVLIKMEGCEEEPEVDVEGMENDSLLADNRESNIEPPRRRDSSDPVNLSLNSGASTTSESSRDVMHRLERTDYVGHVSA